MRHIKCGGVFCRYERPSNRLDQPASGQRAPHQTGAALCQCQAWSDNPRGLRQGRCGHFVQPVNTNDFFDNIGSLRSVINIRPPTGYIHLPRLAFFHLEAQLGQDGLHVGFVNFEAGKLMHTRRLKTHGLFVIGHRARHHRRTHSAAANFNNHLHGQRQTRFDRSRINPALKTIACIAVNIVVTARQRNRHRIKPSAFDQHVFCLKRTARHQASHNTGQAKHTPIIGDNAVRGI